MTKIQRHCLQCGKPFLAERGKVNAGYGKFCSRECYHLSTRNKVALRCRHCGKEFEVVKSERERGTVHCSLECRYAASRIDRVCQQCGGSFTITKADARKSPAVFCTRKCKNAAQRKEPVERKCIACGIIFFVYPYVGRDTGRGKYCSNKCKNQDRSRRFSGPNSGMWRGGTSFEPYGLEWTAELKERIRDRDSHHCAICRLPAKIVHHIDYCKTNNSPENLVVVCGSCHGRTNNEREYWQRTLTSLMVARSARCL